MEWLYMPDGFLSIEDIINNNPGLEKVRRIIKQTDVSADFYKVFPDLEKIALPVKVKKKVLYLQVENPAWRNELKFMEKVIVDKVNQFFKEERIRWVKFLA